MRKIVLWGVPIRVHPTLPLMAALAIVLGMGRSMVIAALSLTLHEVSHVVAARCLRLPVLELELMPFGGAARIDGLWSLRLGQLLLIALSGPFCNLLIVILAAALGWWGALAVPLAGEIISVNLMLMLFNLLPALPLDGGRVLCGLLGIKLGPERAVRAGIWLGRALGILLILAAVAAYLARGQINIVLLLCAAYLIACAERERQSASAAALRSMIDRRSELDTDAALPMRWIAVSANASLGEAVKLMRPRYMHMLAVYDGLHYIGRVDEQTALAAMMRDPAQPVRALLRPEPSRRQGRGRYSIS